MAEKDKKTRPVLEPSEAELIRTVKKKDTLKFEVVLNVFKVTNLPGTVANGSELYMAWKTGKKGAGRTRRIQKNGSDVTWAESASIEAKVAVEGVDKYAKCKLGLTLFEETFVGGKKKLTKVGKLSVNIAQCLKVEPSHFSQPLVLEPKYKGKEVPVLKFAITFKRFIELNNYSLVPADTAPHPGRKTTGPDRLSAALPTTPRKLGVPLDFPEEKPLLLGGKMYRLVPIDEKDDASEDDSDEEDEEARDHLAALRRQVADAAKGLAEKQAIITNQENHILRLQKQVLESRDVSDHEPKFAFEQVLQENTALRDKLALARPPDVPVEELRAAVAILTEKNREMGQRLERLSGVEALLEQAQDIAIRQQAALQAQGGLVGPGGLAGLMLFFFLFLLFFKR